MISRILKYQYLITLCLFAVVFDGCKNQLDQHYLVKEKALTVNLLQQINQDPNLSKFSQYLAQTGYDKIIASSKTFTVWAPTNDALQGVDQTILGDTAKLKLLVANHITNQSYTTSAAQPSIVLKMLDGKNAIFTASTFAGANIVQGNRYVANGILHIISGVNLPKLNIWDYVNSLSTIGLLQKTYLLSQNYSYQDSSLATVVGVTPNGKPVLKPGTGIVNKNHYLDQTQNLQNEDGQFTYIILTDAAYTSETAKVSKYFNTSSTDSTANLAAFNITKDLILPGLITQVNLPDTALSINNVKVPLGRGANIVQTYLASNGIVYVVSNLNSRLVDKITPVVIQGETPNYFTTADKAAAITYRQRIDPGGTPYQDIFIASNSKSTLTAGFYAGYRVNGVNSVTYKVYQRAINEQLSTATSTAPAVPIIFSQQLTIYSPFAAPVSFGYQPVAYLNYSEVLIGTYSCNRYGFIQITNAGGNNTTAGLNSSTLDYLKLVPVLP